MTLHLVLVEDHQALREGLELLLGRDGIDLLIKGLDSGARGYALKEGTQSELRTALTTVAEGGTYVDPRLHPALLSRKATGKVVLTVA